MQIKIEIDVKPEELRRFLGLPDIAGLQEDLVAFLRDKVGSAATDFDPAAFVKGNFDTLRKSQAWQRLLAAAKPRAESGRPPPPDVAAAAAAAAAASDAAAARRRVRSSAKKPRSTTRRPSPGGDRKP